MWAWLKQYLALSLSLVSDDFVSAPVSVVDNCVEGLVGKLPEDHRRWVPENTFSPLTHIMLATTLTCRRSSSVQ